MTFIQVLLVTTIYHLDYWLSFFLFHSILPSFFFNLLNPQPYHLQYFFLFVSTNLFLSCTPSSIRKSRRRKKNCITSIGFSGEYPMNLIGTQLLHYNVDSNISLDYLLCSIFFLSLFFHILQHCWTGTM